MNKIFLSVLKYTAFFLVLSAMAAAFWYYGAHTTPKTIIIREFADTYTVMPVSCDCKNPLGDDIEFHFIPSESAMKQVPKYEIQELPDEARTIVTFHNVSNIKKQFDYTEVTNMPLVDAIDYGVKNGNFVVKIDRKGAYLPAEVSLNGPIATVLLKNGDQTFPVISDEHPADNSAAFPAERVITFKAGINDGLGKAVVLFNGASVEYNATTTEPNMYAFNFNGLVERDKEYHIKTILTDAAGRTTVGVWMFEGMIPVEAALGKDRFKYLGWWGEINADGVAVREKPTSASAKVGELSSINRVKVIKEIDGPGFNNLWYEIDGGKYPHSYIFSDYVTPMTQPAPPAQFIIPTAVKDGDRWIDVDLAKKILTLFEYNKPVFATYISPGRPENPTETGTFAVWYKLKKAEMKGGPPLHSYRYDLKDIPWTMFYNNDYAIHGTYWHDRFGTPQSAGCTNMTQGDAEYIFNMTKPTLASDRQGIFSGTENYGTVVHNHL